MSIGTVYRAPARNAHGDPVDDDGQPIRLSGDGVAKVGTIAGIIFGGQAVQALAGRAETASSEGLIGCPNNAEVILRHGDRIDVDGQRYAVVGPRLFDYPNALTGTEFGLYWIRVEATIG